MNSVNWQEVLQYLCGRSLGNIAMNVTWWFSSKFEKHCQTVAYVPVTQWPLPVLDFLVPLFLVCVDYDVSGCMNPNYLNSLWSSVVRGVMSVPTRSPEGRPWMSDVSRCLEPWGLSFGSTFLSPLLLFCLESWGCPLVPLSCLLSCFSVLSFFLLMVHSPGFVL